VAYVSDRSGKDELWLQQVGGGGPIQLTHDNENEKVEAPAFFPDGKRILYERISADTGKSTIEAISALGGEPMVLTEGVGVSRWGWTPSPDGRQIAYVESTQGAEKLMTLSSNGGQPRELPAWARVRNLGYSSPVWTPDSRYLLCPLMVKPGEAANAEEWEWFAFPVDGGDPVVTGAGATLRAAGLTLAEPRLMTGDRVLFDVVGGTAGLSNVWEIRLAPGSWRVRDVPHQLTFGTLNALPTRISATGTVALEVGSNLNDLYLIPLAGTPDGFCFRRGYI